MSDMTIYDAPQDASVGGEELIPVSDARIPRSMSVNQIKDYILSCIANLTAASGASISDDDVYILQGGALKPVSAATLVAAIFDEAFGRTGVGTVNGNEVLAVKDSTERKTVTVDALKTYIVHAANQLAVLLTGNQSIEGVKTFTSSPVVPAPTNNTDVATKKYVDDAKDAAVLLAGDQSVAGTKTFSSSPVVPAPTSDGHPATKKYVDDRIPSDAMTLSGAETVTGVKTFSASPTVPTPTNDTHAAPKKYVDDAVDVSGFTALTEPYSADDLLVVAHLVTSGSENKKFTMGNFATWCFARLAAFVGNLSAPQSVTSESVVYIVQGGVAYKATVAQLIAAAGGGDVTGPQTTTSGNIPQWDSTTKQLKDGLSKVTAVGPAIGENAASDLQIPTALAVRTAINSASGAMGFVQKNGGVAETITGVKTFSACPKLGSGVAPTAGNDVASKRYVDDARIAANSDAVLKTGNQTVLGEKDFTGGTVLVATPETGGVSSEPDTNDNSNKAANTLWVAAKLAAWWSSIKAEAQAFTALVSLNGGATVPTGKTLTITDAPSADTDAANKKYVDDKVAALRDELVTAGVLSASE